MALSKIIVIRKDNKNVDLDFDFGKSIRRYPEKGELVDVFIGVMSEEVVTCKVNEIKTVINPSNDGSLIFVVKEI